MWLSTCESTAIRDPRPTSAGLSHRWRRGRPSRVAAAENEPQCRVNVRAKRRKGFARASQQSATLLGCGAAAAVTDAINGARIVGGDKKRAVAHRLHIDRPADIGVGLEESGHERFPRPHVAVAVESDEN